ncbi:MAG: hypothetical protein EP314_01480 [Bacteroidetes bacterium]|nr:MAG: hypothetical protein EP314_01480 [Bacteroidota bacterium]
MRSGVLIGLLALIVSVSQGQEGYDRYTNYYSVEAGFHASSGGLAIGPTFGLYRGGHKIDAGLNLKIYDIWKDGPGIMGTYLSYKYYPNQRKNDFNLYFGYHNILGLHDKGKRFPVVYDEVADRDLRPTFVILLENLIGMGFDYQMGNRFFMFCDFSVGAALDWSMYEAENTEMEIRSTGLARLGLGYNISSKKAK